MAFDTAVVFYDECKWQSGEAVCFGVRFDSQALPRRSIVVGFMMWKPGEIGELLALPAMEDNQLPSWEASIQYARQVLADGYSDLDGSPLVL